MGQVIGRLGLGTGLFVSTNIDGVFVLLGFFADPRFKAKHVVIGQYFGIAARTLNLILQD